MKRPQTTPDASFGAVVVNKTQKNNLKKTHLGPKRRQTRRLGPFSSSWACVGLLGCCGPLWAFVGLIRANEGCGRWACVGLRGCCGPSLTCVGLRWPSLAAVGLRGPALACIGLRW